MRVLSHAPELAVLDPATGDAIGHIPAGGVPEANRSGGRRPRRAGPWARIAPEARGSLLKAGARALREHARELAALQTLEVGMPLHESLGGVEAGIAAFEAYAELGPIDRGRALTGDLVVREPRGVVAILMPWCDPLAASCGALAAALVTGNTVVLKPSEKAPLAAERMVELLDLGGILQLLHGDERAARPLATHPAVDLVIRPGEEAAGSHLAIVDEGVDPAWAAREVAASAFAGAGQSCGSVERVYVHRDAGAQLPRRAHAPRADAQGRARDGRRHRAGTGDRRRPPAVGAPPGPGRRLRRRRAARGRHAAAARGLLLSADGHRRRPRRRARALRRDARPGRRPSACCRPSKRR